MSWKDWPYWLKGGIIAAAIYWIVVLLFIIAGPKGWSGLGMAQVLMLMLMPSSWFTLGPLEGFLEQVPVVAFLFVILLQTAIYFVVGVLIGLIIGKIKSKKE